MKGVKGLNRHGGKSTGGNLDRPPFVNPISGARTDQNHSQLQWLVDKGGEQVHKRFGGKAFSPVPGCAKEKKKGRGGKYQRLKSSLTTGTKRPELSQRTIIREGGQLLTGSQRRTKNRVILMTEENNQMFG